MMATAKFLEDALSTNVDESAVNAIVGSLENQLVTTSYSPLSQTNIVHQSQISNASLSGSSIIVVPKCNADSNPGGSVTSGNTCYNVQTSTYSNQIASVSNLISKANESIALVYSQSAVVGESVAGGRVTYSGAQVRPHVLTHNKMQPSLVIKQGVAAGQVSLQPAPGPSAPPAPPVMTLQAKQLGQNIVTSAQNLPNSGQAIIPNVQILNMRPGTPVSAQKSVATVSPRVVIGSPQVVGTRAAAPGITLQTLQGLQPGQQGHLLLKTENGQYQLLRVGPAPAQPGSAALAPHAGPGAPIRLSTVPAHPGVASMSTSLPAPSQTQYMQQAAPPPQPPQPAGPATVTTAQLQQLQQQQQQQAVSAVKKGPQRKASDNTKEKCRNFLANLLDLSSKEPKSVERNVRTLIQELIDALVQPEEFCDRLERLLNASPQPCLIGFLKKSLPLLRQSLVSKELVIEGIVAPAASVAFPSAASSQPAAPRAPAHPAPPTVQAKPAGKPAGGGGVAVLQNVPVNVHAQKMQLGKLGSPGPGPRAAPPGKAAAAAAARGVAHSQAPAAPGAGASKSLLRDREKKAQTFTQQFADERMVGEDDINDVAAMGGVNLAEESRRILGSTELIGAQVRSCKEEWAVSVGAVSARVRAAAQRARLPEPPAGEVSALLALAAHERLRALLERLAGVARHRAAGAALRQDARHEPAQDVKAQLKFLEELDRAERKRQDDTERELLLRAAKSRSKTEDPEQAKLKAKAKEMQRAEMEELRQREANLTALQAIGPRKRPRLEPGAAAGAGAAAAGAGAGGGAGGRHDAAGPGGDAARGTGGSAGSGGAGAGAGARGQLALRTRLKRVNLRDVLHLMEQERDTAHSRTLHHHYLK